MRGLAILCSVGLSRFFRLAIGRGVNLMLIGTSATHVVDCPSVVVTEVLGTASLVVVNLALLLFRDGTVGLKFLKGLACQLWIQTF